MIICQRVVCWRARTSRARIKAVALPGSVRSRVSIRQFLRSLKPCSTGARAADRAWLAWRWAGGLAGPGGFVPGDDDQVARVGIQAGEPEVGEGAEPGAAPGS
jgi:hypothetical protein